MKRLITLFIILALLGAGIYYYRDILDKMLNPPTAPAKEEAKPEPPAPPVQAKEEPKPEPPPAEEPKPEPQPTAPKERPRSAEHAAVLQATATATEGNEEQLQELVNSGKITPEAAQTLSAWIKEHPDYKIEETGIAETTPSGEKQTRYRLVSAKGGDDVVINVTTPRRGKPAINNVSVTPSDKLNLNKRSDALAVVEGFMEALKRGDMDTARRLTSGTDISDATLAGLCIMFEEGDLSMRKNSPIRNMFKNEENAGYLVYMSDGDKQSSNVGLELTYDEEKGWSVKAVAMDTLLDHYEQRGAAEGGVYFPIVKNPQGGDSLVLYFGFNDATLSPRSLSQLKIVANLLKGSKGDLNISGHTDDVGTAEYNQQLSERRAAAVKDALIAHGVAAKQITTKGLGKSQPRRVYRADDNPETIRTIRSGNRRAEIYLDF